MMLFIREYPVLDWINALHVPKEVFVLVPGRADSTPADAVFMLIRPGT